ncbi:DUF6894 family protein [Tardiphaga sp. 866_E4_N2_1]|uniref:DUF6894 family protein n=1 Tax=unclassified Tardiphaga TaxID=2631404 RepID=UPI003F25A0DA
MPKYHFEIVDGFRLEDPVGLDCSDDTQARDVAKNIAHQIAVDIAGDCDRKVVVSMTTAMKSTRRRSSPDAA